MGLKADSGETAVDTEKKNERLAVLAAQTLHGQRAENIAVLDLRQLIDYADFFVIASASSLMRIRGATRAVERALAKAGGKRLNQPDTNTGWALADFGDVLVHVFDNEAREFYRLEELWGDAPLVDWEKSMKRRDGKKA